MFAGFTSEVSVGYLVILAILIFLSMLRSIRGRKYKPGRVLFRPLLYLALGTLVVIGDQSILPLILLSTIAGIVVGLRFGSGATLFFNTGVLYYKRSITLYLIWLVLFLVRVGVEIALPLNQSGVTLVDSLLMFSGGLLVGEAYHLIKKASTYQYRGQNL
ncbi:DUF1453 family protein [Metallosphaera hakonensis]|uniref:DUF1453 domain-containing protein n=1 Tax=Metallosphaera hakonensis JCM 8857 = DSM 7519 TaxID=1293036 RepID=A0A2U9IWB2_9CREN|nr:DUF1453 family protein [Metallosphaera hakonensis]AWS00340.1 DUF1453 family protein [Metallosphaera hakonensis JCM 8857 = DSM 7519]